MKTDHLVVGGGLTGLMAALTLKKLNPSDGVVIVEREPEVGGLLRSFNYGRYGYFDYGMHNFLESGDTELDEMLRSLLPSDEWNVLDGNRRDLAGLYWNKKIQYNSPYPDVRNCSVTYQKELREYLAKETLTAPLSHYQNAGDFVKARFGVRALEQIFEPILNRTFGNASSDLDEMACKLIPLDRVGLFDLVEMEKVLANPRLRERVAYAEQRQLPLEFSSGRTAFYPKEFGVFRVIDSLVEKLESQGVQILVNSKVESICDSDGKISSVEIRQRDQASVITVSQNVHWTAGLLGLAPLLWPGNSAKPPDQPYNLELVNILVKNPSRMQDLYYIYCADREFRTFRVTNYFGYCPKAKNEFGYPLGVEMLFPPNLKLSSEEIQNIALKEVLQMGLIDKIEDISFSKLESFKYAFPLPTIGNTKFFDDLRQKIKSKGISNLVCSGVLAEKSLFFQSAVLRDMYLKVVNRSKVE